MTVLAMSEALATTIVYILIWFVFFPGLVMGMIGYAIAIALGEARENEAERRRRR